MNLSHICVIRLDLKIFCWGEDKEDKHNEAKGADNIIPNNLFNDKEKEKPKVKVSTKYD